MSLEKSSFTLEDCINKKEYDAALKMISRDLENMWHYRKKFQLKTYIFLIPTMIALFFLPKSIENFLFSIMGSLVTFFCFIIDLLYSEMIDFCRDSLKIILKNTEKDEDLREINRLLKVIEIK